jgi:hypothetical protein
LSSSLSSANPQGVGCKLWCNWSGSGGPRVIGIGPGAIGAGGPGVAVLGQLGLAVQKEVFVSVVSEVGVQ